METTQTQSSFLSEIKSRFQKTLEELSDDPQPLLEMIRPAQDSKFGDYQVNCAMPLQKQLGKPPREIAQQLVDSVNLDDLCSKVEIAGPGFVNLTIDDRLIKSKLTDALADDRLGIAKATEPKTIVIDFSSPNVAKPMHVGHIRSTVIGDALAKILKFLGHEVITDNHLGDWGTQFGMIIYGHRNFLDEDHYSSNPIQELGRLYKLVRQLMDYHAAKQKIAGQQEESQKLQDKLNELQNSPAPGDKSAAKKLKKDIGSLKKKIDESETNIKSSQSKIDSVESSPPLLTMAEAHPEIALAVLQETAKLHAGDAENKQLWYEVLPHCLQDIARIYGRLGIEFDHQHGESFYHSMLPEVVDSLEKKNLLTESDGAKCLFFDEFDTPMIVQKKDGAYLYSTSDLATIEYRVKQWNPDTVLYVVDFRQHEHFDKLFNAAAKWGYDNLDLVHVQFGTVLGKDGKPFKTRDGDTVELDDLLSEATSRAHAIVNEADAAKPNGPELSEQEKEQIAQVVGLGALKYADLSHNRTSDYVFDYDKMVAMKGDTATYLQYSYARVQGIFRKGNYDVATLRKDPVEFQFAAPIERALGLQLLRFAEALEGVQNDFRPNLLANYLYELTNLFFKFYGECSVKDAESESLQNSRLQLCDLVARTIKQGLSLLGIDVINKM